MKRKTSENASCEKRLYRAHADCVEATYESVICNSLTTEVSKGKHTVFAKYQSSVTKKLSTVLHTVINALFGILKDMHPLSKTHKFIYLTEH